MIYQGNAIAYIYETPVVLEYIWNNREAILQESINLLKDKDFKDIYITGSGSSYHSAAAAREFLQKHLGIRVHAVYPVPFMEDMGYIDQNSVIIGISQQGTSAASIRVLDEANKRGFVTISVTGEYDTEITRHALANLYVECGYEDAGATTKGYTATTFTLMVLGLELALNRNYLSQKDYRKCATAVLECIANMPGIIEASENWYENIKDDLLLCRNLVILAYGKQRATMLEGVLKFSETCRFPVRGYELEEFMHGMYNAIDGQVYFLYIAAPGKYRERMLKLYNYYAQLGMKQYGMNMKEEKRENLKGCFNNSEEFSILEYILVIQILFVRLSREKGIDLNVPKDPDFHKIMNSKFEK